MSGQERFLLSFTIKQAECIKCASCSSIAPEIFCVEETGAHILRQPLDEIENRLAQAALINCPTGAIRQHSMATHD